jgi:calcium permeable stress-gated cation channel
LLSIEGIVQEYLWMQIVFCWVYSAIVVFWLYRNYKGMIVLRRKYFQSVDYQGSLHSRTLLVTDVPRPARSDEGLAQLAMRFKPQDIPYAQAHIGRDMGELPELLEQHEKAVKRLEKYLAVYLKNPNKLPEKRPTCKPKSGGSKLDAIDYYTVSFVPMQTNAGTRRRTRSPNRSSPTGNLVPKNDPIRLRLLLCNPTSPHGRPSK